MSDEGSSPIGDARGAHMGPASRDELLAALDELLEAERAGARVALASFQDAGNSDHEKMMRAVHRDEARWCAMLSGQIRRLGGEPSFRCGAFYGKAMAIADPVTRLAFLNRGQMWVVRKLSELMLRVQDDMLHADLRRMADSHRDNIDAAEAYLARVDDFDGESD